MSDTVELKDWEVNPSAARHSSTTSFISQMTAKPQARYKFIRTIGFGGMKTVLLVFDSDTGREVAMAIMPDFKERPQSDLERFLREAKLTAHLEHPNIVPVHDIGVDSSGSPYFVMKFLRGQSLGSLLRRLKKKESAIVEEFTMKRLLQIFIRICNAIEFAHSQGICHLDLKPENVNIGEFGEVLVLDWGLARAMHPEAADGTLPPIGFVEISDKRIKGTPGFMAPEQIRAGGVVDERSDIYALGCLLYTMLALSSPLNDQPVDDILMRTVTGDIPDVESVNKGKHDDIPSALGAICRKAMMVEPRERYHRVSELREDIFAFQTGHVPKAENASPLKHAGLFISRNVLILLVIATLLLSIALLVLGYHYNKLVGEIL